MYNVCIRNTTFIALMLIMLLGAPQCAYGMNPDPELVAAKKALKRERDHAKKAIKEANTLWYADGYHALRGEPFGYNVPHVNYKSIFLYPDLVQFAADENEQAMQVLLTDSGMDEHFENAMRKLDSIVKRISNTETRDLLLFA